MDVRVGLWRKLSTEELMPLNCGVECPLDCKEIQPAHSEGDQPWDFFGRNDSKAETLVLWPPHAKSWLIAKDSDAGRDWRQELKGMAEDEMAGWHQWFDGRQSEWTLRCWCCWWTGRPGMHQFMWSQRVRDNWATEVNWTENPSPSGLDCSLPEPRHWQAWKCTNDPIFSSKWSWKSDLLP